jgi:hypothetical protein
MSQDLDFKEVANLIKEKLNLTFFEPLILNFYNAFESFLQFCLCIFDFLKI